MSLPPGLPDEFALERADHLERVETDDGIVYRVLVSRRTGDRTLVREDVVDYDRVDHPAVSGLAGVIGLLAALVIPILGGYYVAGYAIDGGGTWGLAYVVGGFATAMGMLAFNRALWGSRVGDWVYRFYEWNENKHLLVGRDLA